MIFNSSSSASEGGPREEVTAAGKAAKRRRLHDGRRRREEAPSQAGSTSEEDEDGYRKPKSCPGGVGYPHTVSWMGRARSFQDGGGNCSPGRWPPHQRNISDIGVSIASELRKLLREKFGDCRLTVLRLALGRNTASPFDHQFLSEARRRWCRALGEEEKDALRIREHQPFLLALMGRTLKRIGDPDYRFFEEGSCSLTAGVPVGIGVTLPRTPAVFDRVPKVRKYDESVFTQEMLNYTSSDAASDDIEHQFEQEAALGMMYCLPYEVAKSRFGDTFRIAAQGAIDKKDGTYRVIFDGTHGIQLNNNIRIRDRVAFPQIGEGRLAMDHGRRTRPGPHFSLLADISKAHRRFVYREQDHGYLCCRSDREPTPSRIWVNRVGTFGVASAAYWWGRLGAGASRIVMSLMGREFIYQFLFADDLRWTAHGTLMYENLLLALLAWETMGAPISWKKVKGGLEFEWIGYEMDFVAHRIGLSIKRASWLRDWARGTASAGLAMGRRFQEGLGRLCYSSAALRWARPLLGPLYAWGSKVRGGAVRPLPKAVVFILRYLANILDQEDGRLVPAEEDFRQLGERFRTDAKISPDEIVLGGWQTYDETGGRLDRKAAKWFSTTISREDAPWLFCGRESSAGRGSVSTAELLATMLGVVLFTSESTAGNCLITGKTDNRGNSFVIARMLTTKAPQIFVLIALSEVLRCRRTWLRLDWVPRHLNEEADSLTNRNFSGFSAGNRRGPADYAAMMELPEFGLLDLMQEMGAEMMELRMAPAVAAPVNREEREKTDWG